MFSAHNELGKLVTITPTNVSYLKRQTNYYCQCCNSKLTIKNGSFKQPHFAHPKGTRCSIYQSCGESENHLKGKLDIANWLLLQGISLHLEKYYPRINRQADIEFEEENIIEFQCSTIPILQLIRRTEDYRSLRKKVNWLLGQPIGMKKGRYLFTRFQQAFINFTPNLGYYVISYLPQCAAFEVLYHLTFEHGNRFLGRRLRLPLTLSLSEMKQKLTHIRYQPFSIKKDEKLERERICYYYTKYEAHRSFMYKMYQMGYCLQNLPKEIGVTLPAQFLTRTPAIEWQFYLGYYFLNRLEKGENFKFMNLKFCFLRHIKPTPGVYLDLDALDDLLKQYLLYLEERRMIVEFKNNHFRIKQKFTLKKNSSPYALF